MKMFEKEMKKAKSLLLKFYKVANKFDQMEYSETLPYHNGYDKAFDIFEKYDLSSEEQREIIDELQKKAGFKKFTKVAGAL
jgi:hypothetical protein